MARHYCSAHGEYSGDCGCPECQRAEKRSEEASDALLEKLADLSETASENAELSAEAAKHAAYLTNNPGDYECPACQMKSLKRQASRCPKCQTDVTDAYWKPILERERIEEEQRRKWLASPEYAEQQRVRREAEQKVRHEAEMLAGRKKKIAAGIWGILLGGLGIHKFILGYTKEGIIQIVITVFTCGLGNIIGLIEGIIYLTKSDEDFVKTYVQNKKGWF